MHGSGALVRWLLENDLVDEMTLLIVPVVVGQGTRLFPDDGPDIALDLVESRAYPKGVTIQVYRPAGRPQYATTADPGHVTQVTHEATDRLLDDAIRKSSARRCRIGAEVFVAGVSGRPRGAPERTGDDPRCSIWFP